MASFIKDLSSVGLSKIIIIVLSLATSIITARYIGPAGNGIIAGITIYPSLFMSIGALGIRQSAAFFIGKDIYSEERLKRAITQIWIFTTIISIIICLVLIRNFSNSGNDFFLTFLALIPIPFSLFTTYNSGIFLGKNDIAAYNRINWIPPFIIFIGTIFFVVFIKLDVVGVMISSILGHLFMAILLLLRNDFLKSFSLKIEFDVIKPLISLGIVYAISLLIINLNYKIDIIFMDKLCTPSELGIYTKGMGVTQYLWQIPMLFSTLVFARSASSKDGVKFSFKVAQLLRLSFLAIGLVSIVLYLFSELLIVGMYGEAFRPSISVFNYLLPGVIILTVFKVMNMDLAGKGKPWVALKAMLPALIVNIVLNSFLIPNYGANGAAIASTISYSVAGIIYLFIYSQEVKIPVKEILKFKKEDFQPFVVLLNNILKK